MKQKSTAIPASGESILPVIGITGGVGAGKSTVARLFAKWGGVLISGDAIGKLVVDRSAQVRRQLARTFGHDILRSGRVRRSLLAERAFADSAALARLNGIVHPPLLAELNGQIDRARRSQQHRAVVVDAALLPEWGRGTVPWDWLVGVWAPLVLRRQRMRKRGWSDAQIRARARRQISWTARRAIVDYVVKNNGSLTLLECRARLCWEKILLSC